VSGGRVEFKAEGLTLPYFSLGRCRLTLIRRRIKVSLRRKLPHQIRVSLELRPAARGSLNLTREMGQG